MQEAQLATLQVGRLQVFDEESSNPEVQVWQTLGAEHVAQLAIVQVMLQLLSVREKPVAQVWQTLAVEQVSQLLIVQVTEQEPDAKEYPVLQVWHTLGAEQDWQLACEQVI